MTSRNRTLRCPVSTRYSKADAKSLGSESPEIAGLSVDMLKSLTACSPLHQDCARLDGTIDIGQGKERPLDAQLRSVVGSGTRRKKVDSWSNVAPER